MVKKRTKQRDTSAAPICEHCREIVHPGIDGGRVRIDWTISGEPTRDVILHNRCLREYMTVVEARRRPIMPTTTLERDKSGITRRVG